MEHKRQISLSELKPIYPFLFAINGFLLYILFFYDIFLYIFYYSAIFLILHLSYLYFLRRKSTIVKIEISPVKKLRDNTKLIVHYFYASRRFLFLSFVGIIIVSLIISQIFIAIKSQEQFYFDDLISKNDSAALRIIHETPQDYEFGRWYNYFEQRFEAWFTNNNLEVINHYIEYLINFFLILGENYDELKGMRWLDVVEVQTMPWTQEYFNLLKNFPSFPFNEYNPDESFIIIPYDLKISSGGVGGKSYMPNENFLFYNQLTDKYDMNISLSELINVSFEFTTFGVDNYWHLTQQDIQYYFENNLLFPREYLFGALYLPSDIIKELWTWIDTATDLLGIAEPNIDFAFQSNVHLKLPNIGEINLEDYYARLDVSITNAQNSITANYPLDVITITSPLGELLELYLENNSQLGSILFIILLPLSMLMFILILITVSMVDKRRKELFEKLSYRGLTSLQFLVIISLETIITSILSPLIGIIISLPLVGLFFKLINYFEIINIDVGVVLPKTSFIVQLFVIIFILNLQINLFLTERMVDKFYTNKSGSDEFSSKIKLLLFTVLAILLSIPYVIDKSSIIRSIFLKFGGILLFIIIFTLPLVLNSLFVDFFTVRLQRFKLNSGLLKISSALILSNKKFVKILSLLLILSVLYANFVIIIFGLINYNEDQLSMYEIGAEVNIKNFPASNSSELSKLSFEEVDSVSGYNFID
ncbi:MAG: hypothetical protein OEZ01_17460, partial [Candidatus Heimdallarchaeota archaeon]|nr:hypothetical protein [Candidatus Heimdallarchaeota archaeon]